MKISTIKSNPVFKKIVKNILIALFWLSVWQLFAAVVGSELLVVSPLATVKTLISLAAKASFWQITAYSLFRILSGFVFGCVAGILLATLSFQIKFIGELTAPLLSVVKATPVASFIILLLIWIKGNGVPTVISFLMVLPVIWNSVFAGLTNTDRKLYEVTVMYGFTPWEKIRRLYAPSVSPYLRAGILSAVGLAWKAGVAAEVLCLPKSSIGRELYQAKLYLESADLFAWTALLILLSYLLELGMGKILGKAGKRPS